MQTQKELIKNKIMDAALEEFLVAGYTQSSMRNIALQAGITVGNIYSYFSSKEDLYDLLLQETVAQLQQLILIEVPRDNPLSAQSITEITHYVSQVFLKNRIQFLILIGWERRVEISEYQRKSDRACQESYHHRSQVHPIGQKAGSRACRIHRGRTD